MRESRVGHLGILGHIVFKRSIVLRAIPFVATIWIVAAASCAVAAPTPAPAGGPPQIPHSLEGREGRCLLCHEEGVAGAPRVPVNHAGRASDTCTACHQPAASATTTPVVTATPTPTAAPAGPPAIPHTLEGRDLCLGCHGSGSPAFPQVPADHAGRANETCTLCHSSTDTPTSVASTPTPTPEAAATGDSVRGKALYAGECAACHGEDATGQYGPSLTGLDPDDMEQAVRQGKGGMPAYDANTITEQDMEDIMAYMGSLASTGGGR